MTSDPGRMERIRRSLTRERKAPDWIDSEIRFFGSEEHRRLSKNGFRLALIGLAYGGALYAVGWVVFTVFHLQ